MVLMASEAENKARFRDEDEFNTQRRAGLLGLQYFDTRGLVANARLFPNVITVQEMHKGRLIPFSDGVEDAALMFGITVSTPQPLLTELRDRFSGRVVKFLMISDSGFKEFMQRYDPPRKVVYQDVKIAKEGDSAAIAEVSKTLDSVRSDEILNYLIAQADKLGASDIHLENQQKSIRVRLRVDGALHPVATLSHDKYRVLLAAIASRGNISTAATDAQTGHIQQEMRSPDGNVRQLNMRIESVPTIYGQDVVMRLFNFDPQLLSLDRLGLDPRQLKNIKDIVDHPHGMVMVVGPTGSGKSTTLYSVINSLNSTDRKILTLEDPVELAVPGVVQIPVDTQQGDSFAEKLRAVLRLDPDIVMVGEIRDVDTAKTAIQASITGHLVLSTFHASSAATAFSRIIDMIGQNPIFSNAIRLVIGQRLVRRLDDKTKQPYKPDEATKKFIAKILEDLPKDVAKPNVDDLTLYKPGVSAENPFGYRGRLVVMEQMAVHEKIQAYLRGDITEIDADSIEKTAKQEGMVTIMQDGILKACQGLTTLEEVNRVI